MNNSAVDELLKIDKNYVQQINMWLNQQMENFPINDFEGNLVPENFKLKVVDRLLKSIVDLINEEASNPDKICNGEATTRAGNLKNSQHLTNTAASSSSWNLPQSSLRSVENQSVIHLKEDRMLCSNLTTIVKIANDSIDLLSTMPTSITQIKEKKPTNRISNIRRSEGPLVNLIDINTPIRSNPQRKYLTPKKLIKEPVTRSNCTENVKGIQDALRKIPKLAECRKESTITLTPPQYTSSPERNRTTNVIESQVSCNSLTTIVKVANDLVNVITKRNNDISEITNVEPLKPFLIDLDTPIQLQNKRKVLTPKPARIMQPKKMLRSSTYTTMPQLSKPQSNLSGTKRKSSSDTNLTNTSNK